LKIYSTPFIIIIIIIIHIRHFVCRSYRRTFLSDVACYDRR